MSHPHDPNRWPEPAENDPRQSVPNERVWPSTAWHETPMPPAKRGRMPWWAWLLLGLGAAAVLILALILWAAVAINGQDRAAEQAPVPAATTQAPTTQPAATPSADSEPDTADRDAYWRAVNARDFPADQAAYLDGVLADARPVYMARDNTVTVAMGLGACLLLEQGLDTATVVNRLPAEHTEVDRAEVLGHAVQNLCPEQRACVAADLAA
jgi:hypothetical protein